MPIIGKTLEESLIFFRTKKNFVLLGKVVLLSLVTMKDAVKWKSVSKVMAGRRLSSILLIIREFLAMKTNVAKV